jgi:hypothetical protein
MAGKVKLTESEKIRKNILRILVLISSKNLQLEYQKKVPIADVSSELFCQWESEYFPNDKDFKEAFNKKEYNEILNFNSILNEVSTSTPKNLPFINEFIKTDEWEKLSSGAKKSLFVFSKNEVDFFKSEVNQFYTSTRG